MTNNNKPQKGIFNLYGRVGLVTGGGGNLARAFCEALAEYGADVAISDLDEEAANRTAEIVKQLGRKSLVVKADVTNPDETSAMVDKIVTTLGGIDILVNNAGISTKAAKIAEMKIDDWDRVMSVNLKGVFLCTRAVIPLMVKQKKGCIINIASVKGIRPFFPIVGISPKAHYAVAKAGVISLTKETALEYVKDGIRANCIAPGWHRGAGLGGQWRKSTWSSERIKIYEATIKEATPMGRRGEASELKGLLIYLASDASSFVTGQVFISDGGICV